MREKRLSSREIKKIVLADLKSEQWEDHILHKWKTFPPQRLVSPLFTSLYALEDLVRWHGVTAFGHVVPRLAQEDMNAARVVLRRFMWNLTDESGGIGWGSPEAMGEILANHDGLAREYSKILISYIVIKKGPDNYLEFFPLRKGAYWGIARLSQAQSDLARQATDNLIEALSIEKSPLALGLICLALGYLSIAHDNFLRSTLNQLTKIQTPIQLYWDRKFWTTSLSELARFAQKKADQSPND